MTTTTNFESENYKEKLECIYLETSNLHEFVAFKKPLEIFKNNVLVCESEFTATKINLIEIEIELFKLLDIKKLFIHYDMQQHENYKNKDRIENLIVFRFKEISGITETMFNKIKIACENSEKLLAATIIDDRLDHVILDSVWNARANIPSKYPIYIFSNRKNYDFYSQKYFRDNNIHLNQNFNIDGKNVENYNLLLKNVSFWNSFEQEYILIFQRDSRFCMNTKFKIENFIGLCDYLGSPWV